MFSTQTHLKKTHHSQELLKDNYPVHLVELPYVSEQIHYQITSSIMAPSAISDIIPIADNQETAFSISKVVNPSNGNINGTKDTKKAFHLNRNLKKSFPVVTGAKGNYLFLEDGRAILDAAGGAAVSCLGHGDQRVIDAITGQRK